MTRSRHAKVKMRGSPSGASDRETSSRGTLARTVATLAADVNATQRRLTSGERGPPGTVAHITAQATDRPDGQSGPDDHTDCHSRPMKVLCGVAGRTLVGVAVPTTRRHRSELDCLSKNARSDSRDNAITISYSADPGNSRRKHSRPARLGASVTVVAQRFGWATSVSKGRMPSEHIEQDDDKQQQNTIRSEIQGGPPTPADHDQLCSGAYIDGSQHMPARVFNMSLAVAPR